MITITLRDLVNATTALQEMGQTSLTGSLAFRIARLLRELDNENKTFNEQRSKLITQFCVKDADGNPETNENGDIKLQEENIAQFYEQFETLLNTEITINVDKIPIRYLDEFKLTPQQALNVEKFFAEE